MLISTVQQLRTQIVGLATVLESMKVRESKIKPNRGEIVDAIQKHAANFVGYPWCVAFCDFVVEKSYEILGLVSPINLGVSSSDLYRRAKADGRIIPTEKAESGDVMLLKGGPTGWKHAGIVVQRLSNGHLVTIEGNTNDAGSAEGDGVYRKVRDPKKTALAIVSVVPAVDRPAVVPDDTADLWGERLFDSMRTLYEFGESIKHTELLQKLHVIRKDAIIDKIISEHKKED